MNLVLIDASMAGVSGDRLLSAFADMMDETKRLQFEDSIAQVIKAVDGIKRRQNLFENVMNVGQREMKLSLNLDHSKGKDRDPEMYINDAITSAPLGRWGNNLVKKAYGILKEAENRVHGGRHLQDLIDADTAVDIVGVMKAIELLSLDNAEFYSTAVSTGCGWVECGHCKLPVPAPVTLEIMERAKIPMLSSSTNVELTTPTGAAIVSALTDGKTSPPPFKIVTHGIGVCGGKLPFSNMTRVLIGQTGDEFEQISVIETNVDDVTGEVLGWLIERLQTKVEDISIIPTITKKNRPGYMIRAVAKPEQKMDIINEFIMDTGTLGVKVFDCNRLKVERVEKTTRVLINGRKYQLDVKLNKKTGFMKPSFEGCKAIAEKEGISLLKAMELVRKQIQLND